MKEAYKYLYFIAVTCIIGVGSGFVTLSPNVIIYEQEANFLKHKVEDSLKIKLDKNTNCEKQNKLVEECNNALYSLKTSESYISLLTTLVNLLFTIAAMTGSLGFYLNVLTLINNKNEKT